MTLRQRLATVTGIAVALVAIALATGAYAAARSALRGELDGVLADTTRLYQGGGSLSDSPDGRGHGKDRGSRRPGEFGAATGAVQFLDPGGTASRPTGETSVLPVTASASTIARTGVGTLYEDVTSKGVHLRIRTVGLGSGGAVQAARPLTELDQSLRRLLVVLSVVASLGVAAAALIGAMVARTALAPVTRFTRRIEMLLSGADLSQRLDEGGRDELSRLAHSFNGSLEALERSVDAQRHLVVDASHELRTPIASLRANIQLLEHSGRLAPDEVAGVREDIVTELDGLTALVGDIVELARGARPSDAPDDVRLDLIASELVARFERRAGAAVTFHQDLEETVVRGDPERVGRAVSNLIENACKWSPPGGRVEIRLAARTLSVRDHGPGFVDKDIEHVFDRFFRADVARSKPGSGLGLAIVKQTIESMGGSVQAANADGGGAFVSMHFPDDNAA